MRSRSQQLTLCRSLHAEALEATASEGLAQVPYVAASAGFEPLRFGRKASTLPMCHHSPPYMSMYNVYDAFWGFPPVDILSL